MNKLLQLPLWPQQHTRSVHLHLLLTEVHHGLRRPAKPCLAALLRLQAKLPRATVQVSAAGISQNLINHTTLLCWWKLKRHHKDIRDSNQVWKSISKAYKWSNECCPCGQRTTVRSAQSFSQSQSLQHQLKDPSQHFAVSKHTCVQLWHREGLMTWCVATYTGMFCRKWTWLLLQRNSSSKISDADWSSGSSRTTNVSQFF